jgi:hypothetical protein
MSQQLTPLGNTWDIEGPVLGVGEDRVVRAAQSTYRAEFRSGLRATLTISTNGVTCEWTPDLPRSLEPAARAALIEAYRAWRDECLEEFARAHRLTIRTVCVNGFDCISFLRVDAA